MSIFNLVESGKRVTLKFLKNNKPELYTEFNNYITSNDLSNLTFVEQLYCFDTKNLSGSCKACGKPTTFKNTIEGYRPHCSSKCFSNDPEIKEKREQTSLLVFGVRHASQTQEIKDKVAEKNIEIYGHRSSFQNKDVQEKYRKNMLEKHGADSPLRVKEFSEKATKKLRKTIEERGEEIVKKREETTMATYGVKSFLLTEACKSAALKRHKNDKDDQLLDLGCTLVSRDKNYYTIRRESCNHTFTIEAHSLNKRIADGIDVCNTCLPSNNASEKTLFDFIKNIYSDQINFHDKQTLPPYELDIYLPDKKIAIEFNGLYWHSEKFRHKAYHKIKRQYCEKDGIKLIQVWEDDWYERREIIESLIKNKIGLGTRIGARSCEIKEVSSKESSAFLEKNHLQGNVGASVKIGLYYNNQLVQLMTFSNRRNINKTGMELTRLCTALGYSISGGAERLFKEFRKNYSGEITSYCDLSYFDGSVYSKLGLTKSGETLGYWWCRDRRYYRYNFAKHKLVQEGFDPSKTEVQIMHERKYFRVWDAGQTKYILENK